MQENIAKTFWREQYIYNEHLLRCYASIAVHITNVCYQFLKKMNRQERVVEEVKLAIKPHYAAGKIDKGEYKEIMRKAVPKVRECSYWVGG